MTFLNSSDSNVKNYATSANSNIVNLRMSYFLIGSGTIALLFTIALLHMENFSRFDTAGTISLITVGGYIMYSSSLVILIGLIFNRWTSIKKIKDSEIYLHPVLVMFLMIIILTVFPLINSASILVHSFFLINIIYGILTISLITSIIKNLIMPK